MAARTPANIDFYCGFDLETTGLDPVANGIIEIGAIMYSRDGVEVDRFIRSCNPGDEVVYVPQALATNNVTREQIATFEPVKKTLCDFVAWVNKYRYYTVVISNATFDVPFITEQLRIYCSDLEDNWRWTFCKPIDVYGFSHALYPCSGIMSQARLGEVLGVGNECAHSAGGDIEQMMTQFFALLHIAKTRERLDSERGETALAK